MLLWSLSKAAFHVKPGTATGSGACGFGVKSRAKLTNQNARDGWRAPFTPKPGRLTQSPCLALLDNRLDDKAGCSHFGIGVGS